MKVFESSDYYAHKFSLMPYTWSNSHLKSCLKILKKSRVKLLEKSQFFFLVSFYSVLLYIQKIIVDNHRFFNFNIKKLDPLL